MMKSVRVEYDKSNDTAYFYMKYPVAEGEAARTESVNEDIHLDFDSGGKLLGVEVLNASSNLNDQALLNAELV